LTLSIGEGFLGLGKTNIAGTANGSSIDLETVDSQGVVNSYVFVRASLLDFNSFAERIRAKGRATAVNARLADFAKSAQSLIASTQSYLADAESHLAYQLSKEFAALSAFLNALRSGGPVVGLDCTEEDNGEDVL